MQRKASAHWQGSTQGRQRHALDAKRHAEGHAVFVQGALRRRQGHQSRGADRRRARRLLHDGAVVHAQQRGFTAEAIDTEAQPDDGPGRRQADDHRRPSDHARARARASTPPSSPRSRRREGRTASSRARFRRRSRSRCDAVARGLTTARIDGRPAAAADQGPRRDVQSGQPLPPRAARSRSTTAGRAAPTATDGGRRTAAAAQDDRARSSARARSSRATIRPTSRSRSRSIRTRAASTAASTATRGRRTPISTSRRGSTSRPSSSPSPTRRSCCAPSSRSPATSATRSRSAPTPIPTSRSSANGRSRARMIEVLAACEHPLTITTKGALVERDLDLLAPMAAKKLVARLRLDRDARPRARAQARPARRRAAPPAGRSSRRSREAGVPVGVIVAPVIPQLTDKRSRSDPRGRRRRRRAHARAGRCCGCRARWRRCFATWLDAHYPLRAAHVMSIVQQIRGGRDNDPRFGARMRGRGEFADLIAQALRARVQAPRPQPRARRAARHDAVPAAARERAASSSCFWAAASRTVDASDRH